MLKAPPVTQRRKAGRYVVLKSRSDTCTPQSSSVSPATSRAVVISNVVDIVVSVNIVCLQLSTSLSYSYLRLCLSSPMLRRQEYTLHCLWRVSDETNPGIEGISGDGQILWTVVGGEVLAASRGAHEARVVSLQSEVKGHGHHSTEVWVLSIGLLHSKVGLDEWRISEGDA